jgi:hypothetical protein
MAEYVFQSLSSSNKQQQQKKAKNRRGNCILMKLKMVPEPILLPLVLLFLITR